MAKEMAWVAMAVLVLASLNAVTSRRCCPGNETFNMANKRCNNASRPTSRRSLNCTKGAYMVDPNERIGDTFSVTEADILRLGITGPEVELIEPDRYCVTQLIKPDGITSPKEIAFVCFPEDDHAEENQGSSLRQMVLGIFMFISAVFLLATLTVYVILPETRDLEGKCLMSAMLALLISFIMLATLQFHGSHLGRHACVAVAFVLYYWMLATFFWLNVVSFNLWRTVVHPSTTWSDQRLFGSYSAYGWGCPLIFLIVALVTHNMPGKNVLRPGFGETKCWFEGNVETWSYFYGPIAVIIACNIGFFVTTAWNLWSAYNSREIKLQSLRYKCNLYSKLFVIMGIAWIFELLSHLLDPESKSYFWLATDIFNTLQGVFIFIVTVVCRRRVLRGLERHRPWGLTLPKKWAAGVDEESDAVPTDEVVEMSQTQAQNT